MLSEMMLHLWQDVREAHYDAVRQYWSTLDSDNAILLLELSIRRTETLISALRKECQNKEK